MNRVAAIISAALLAFVGSGALSAIHRATHQCNVDECGSHASLRAIVMALAAEHVCVHDACVVGHGSTGRRHEALVDGSPWSEESPSPVHDRPSEADECGFCLLLAMPSAPANPVIPTVTVHARHGETVTIAPHVAIPVAWRASLGARAPPLV